MTDTVDPIGIVGTGRVAQTLGRLLSENGRPVAAIAGRNPERTALAALFIGGRTTPVTIEELPALSSHVLIAVSDRGVKPVAEILAKSRISVWRRSSHVRRKGASGVSRS
jgi:predicted dinucleotide-binding enzyme